MNISNDDFSVLLREKGLRVTSPRLTILSVLKEHHHLDAEQIKNFVKQYLGTVSTQAVYDSLNIMTTDGILRRVEPRACSAVYEIDFGDNHHHFVRNSCGQLLDVPCSTGEKPCLEANIGSGYSIDEAEVIYWGTCPSCNAK